MQKKAFDSKQDFDKWSDENFSEDSIGKNCCFELCKQRDFLPFKCKYCQKLFCLDHKDPESHKCQEYFKEMGISQESSSGLHVFLECPLCFAKFPISKGADPNFEMEKHFAEDCKKESNSKRRKNTCSAKGCSKEAISTCPSCSKIHRIENDHSCPNKNTNSSTIFGVIEKQNSKSIEKKTKPSSIAPPSGLTGRDVIEFYKMKKQNKLLADLNEERQKRQETSISPTIEIPKKSFSSSSSSNETVLSKAKYQKLKAKYFSDQFQNLQSEPRGNQNIEIGDRFFADVYFPLFSKKKPIHIVCFFSKKWKFGVILDKIANEGGIVNENNEISKDDPESKAKRLNLFHLNSATLLPVDQTIEEFQNNPPSSCVFSNYEPLLLEYGEKLRPEMDEIISKFKNSSLGSSAWSMFSPTTLEEIKSCVIG